MGFEEANYDSVSKGRDAVANTLREQGLEPGNVKDDVILGSGLGGFAENQMHEDSVVIPFNDAYKAMGMHPVEGEVVGHARKLVIGPLKGGSEDRLVFAQAGREHPYEGVSTRRATVFIKLARLLGAENLIAANAGGVVTPHTLTPILADPEDREGAPEPSLLLVNKSLDLSGDEGPLVGPNDPRWGTRFPDRGDVYPEKTCRLIREMAADVGVPLTDGMYVRMPGPEYEDRETIYRIRELLEGVWRQAQMQAGETRFEGEPVGNVGMSSTYEFDMANYLKFDHRGLISVPTNYAASLGPNGITAPCMHGEVAEAALAIAAKFEQLIHDLLQYAAWVGDEA